MTLLPRYLIALVISLSAIAGAFAQQTAEPTFDPGVKVKTYAAKEHPRVGLDEAHNNVYIASDRFKPLGDLLTNDGYEVLENKEKFQPQTLRSLRVLVIANAQGEGSTESTSPAAFTDAECDIVRDWVSDGGSLLLAADHAPFANAAATLARTFGVSMGKGIAFDLVNFAGSPTNVVFRTEKGGLGDHPIIRGRNPGERLKQVVSYSGQTLSVPGIGVSLLKFGPTAHEAENSNELQLALEAARTQGASAQTAIRHATPALGRAQAVALTFGRGRVVILGDAAMLSADKQFALNVMHWLSSAL